MSRRGCRCEQVHGGEVRWVVVDAHIYMAPVAFARSMITTKLLHRNRTDFSNVLGPISVMFFWAEAGCATAAHPRTGKQAAAPCVPFAAHAAHASGVKYRHSPPVTFTKLPLPPHPTPILCPPGPSPLLVHEQRPNPPPPLTSAALAAAVTQPQVTQHVALHPCTSV